MPKSAPQLLVFATALTPQLEVELHRRRVIIQAEHFDCHCGKRQQSQLFQLSCCATSSFSLVFL